MNRTNLIFAGLLGLSVTACKDDHDHDHDDENEVITTIDLTFSPVGGGDDILATWTDPEDDGNPVIDDIVLANGTDYTLAVAFFNGLEDPAEDITEEVEEESDEHQVFFAGTAVDGPAGTGSAAVITHAYADEDDNGFPVGLESDITTTGTGTGTLRVLLRHMPPEDGEPVKTGDLAELVASDGFGALPGDNDVDVTFDLTVE